MHKVIVIKQMLQDFYPFAAKRLGFDKPVKIKLLKSIKNAMKPLGKTAFYEPNNSCISVYTHNRHPKDVLRSIAHELVHHMQNCRGRFDQAGAGGVGYAQKNSKLRELEEEAYALGNMVLRDWEDSCKEMNPELGSEVDHTKGEFFKGWEPITVPRNVYPSAGAQYKGEEGTNIMEHFNIRNIKLNKALMERWGYKQPVNEELAPEHQYTPGENLKPMQQVPFPVNMGGDEDEDYRATVQQLADAGAPSIMNLNYEELLNGGIWQPSQDMPAVVNAKKILIDLPKKVMNSSEHLDSHDQKRFAKLKNDFPEYIASLEADPNKTLMERWGYKQPVSEGRWADDVVRPTGEQRNSLGGKLTFNLNNTPGARAIQKGFDLASANEPAVWGDEDNIRNIQTRSRDIENTYFEYNQLLQGLTKAEEKYPEIGAINYYTPEVKNTEEGPEGYRSLAFIEVALQEVVKLLTEKGKEHAAEIVNQVSEKVMTLNNNLRNTLGYEASR